MRRAALSALTILFATPVAAQAPPVTLDATLSGQAIRAPSGDLRVTIAETTLPPGGRLPVHMHPHPRLVKVLAGRLKVINLDTGQSREVAAGDWMVDAVDQWHEAEVLGGEAVRLMTIDHAPPGAQVTVLKQP